MAITDRAGRWATEQVGGARGVADVAREFGCDCDGVNDAVMAYGEALMADPGRYWQVSAWVRRGAVLPTGAVPAARSSPSRWSTSRAASSSTSSWKKRHRADSLAEGEGTGVAGRGRCRHPGPLGSLPAVSTGCCPSRWPVRSTSSNWPTRSWMGVARRVQNDTRLGTGDARTILYRCRRLLTEADGRLDGGREELVGLLRAR